MDDGRLRHAEHLKRNFSKVLIVKINAEFEVAGRLVDRRSLPRVKGDRLLLDWEDLQALAGGRTGPGCSP
jgi:hypothetical protein